MAFNRDRNSGRGGGRSGGFNDRRGRERPQMFPAICSNCGKACEVPFRPNGSKPVLCNDCFRQNGGPERRPDNRPRFDKPGFEPRPFENLQGRRDDKSILPLAPHRKEFDSINRKLDKILDILTAVTEAEIPQITKKEIIKVIEEAPEAIPVTKKKSREAGSGSARKKSPKVEETAADPTAEAAE